MILSVTTEVVEELKEAGEVELEQYTENQYFELKSPIESVLGVFQRGVVRLVKSHTVSGIKPRNKEQVFSVDALLDKGISIVILTGTAGSGKTICSLAAALTLLDKKQYRKIILSKPMSQVGKYQLGALPGESREKFFPYLSNFSHNFEKLCNRKLEDIVEQYRIEVIPLQLIRGASFEKSLIIIDEVQVLTPLDILTIGTRVGEKSKLVLMGDLEQIDDRIEKEKTGLYKLINSEVAIQSPLFANIELIKNERSETSKLFSSIFRS